MARRPQTVVPARRRRHRHAVGTTQAGPAGSAVVLAAVLAVVGLAVGEPQGPAFAQRDLGGRVAAAIAAGADGQRHLAVNLPRPVSDRWKSDMGSDSWLSKNIRPMALIAIFVAYFVFTMMSAFGHSPQEGFVNLLGQWGQICFLAYFGGRTVEKLADMRNKNAK